MLANNSRRHSLDGSRIPSNCVVPYFSPSDIEKGSKWDTEITGALNDARMCIIALTRENLTSKWILFEAGAISQSVDDKSLVCPILFGIEPTEVEFPLASFQFTEVF